MWSGRRQAGAKMAANGLGLSAQLDAQPTLRAESKRASSPPNSATPVRIPGFDADFVGFQETS
jgi:hypothetical protein